MNLALHGFLLQVILSILNFKHGFRLCSAGEPGYLDFDNLPETNFSCQGKVIGGYYADVEAGCQMFHVCTIGQKDEIMDIKFLCLNGTVFDQETRVCERVDEVDCSKSERFYNLNLELYGNNAVTLSLHEEEDDDDSTEPRDEHQQHHMTSVGPSTTSSTTTTTSRPNQSPTTSANKVYQQHATGYPQHYQPRPAFPSVQTSQSNTHYDDKNGGYHHQYIFHNDERNNNNQATSYQLFSNQGASSTTPTPQVHQQVRYSSTSNPQVIHNEPSTATPVQYHIQSTSSTIQTLLNNNGNNPSIINPLYHNHGIASTTEQFNIHNNNPREIAEYQDNSEDEHDEHVERKPLEPVQSSNQGKVSKLTISPVPQQENRPSIQTKTSSQSSQQQRISINYLPTPSPIQTTISTFYPTQRSSSQKPQKSQSNQQVTQHIHVPPPPVIPQLKPHQITINLPPPDIQRIVQNPSPLLPSQSRVIVTAKASVSDESGRPLNASQLITLPLPTIPSNYDDYKEGDESFDPFYRDVPKIRNDRRIIVSRKVESNERSLRKKRSIDSKEYDGQPSEEVIYNAEIKDIKDLKANLPIIKAILFGLPLPQNETTGDISLKMDDTNTKINNDEFFDTDYKYTENYEDENIQENIRLFEKLAENEENINSTVVLVHEKTKNENEKKHLKNDQIDDVNLEHQQPLVFIQNEIKTNRTIMNNPVNTELKDTVQLFLNAIGNSNSTSLNENSSLESKLNLTKITENTTKKSVEPRSELIKIRFSSNSNKSNHTRYQDEESTESEEYLPRRNGRNNRPKSFRYYDDYDASESIELGTRQRSNRLRQRPQEKQGISYRNEYVDVGDEEYEDENLNINRKSSVRRGPQGRRVLSRNRNRYFDYEDDIEVHEKPRLRAKVSNTSTRTRVRPTLDRRSENRRRRPQTERRRNERRRPASYIDNVPLQNENENTTSRVTEESNLKLSQKVNPPKIEGNMENIEYNSPKKEQQGQLTTTERVRSNSLEKNKELTVKQNDHAAHDYKDSHFYEYTESVERELPDDYVDYVDLRAHLSRINNENRRNKNRYDYEFGPVLRRNSYRRDKSRKLPTVERDEIEEKTEYENIEFTTISNNQDLKTTVLPTEYTISDEISTQEYEDYSLINTTSKIDDIGSTDLEESTVITTENVRIEGILKFTDELPFTDKIEDTIEEKEATTAYIKQKDTTSLEDYVDDNYEPDSYIEPKSKQTSFQKVAKENNTRILTIDLNEETKTIDNHEVISDETATTNDKTKSVETATITGDETLDAETETINNDKADNGSHIKSENYENFDEIYNDKLENITTSFSSEDYYDSEITADPSSSPATMLPISKIVEMTTFSSTEKRSMATTTTNATTTSTVPPTSTLITVASTTSTTVSTMSPTIISSSVSPKTNISTTVKYKTTAKFLKPTAFRKNYVYNPTSTSPNPVIIRRGHPLAGPKPTKPPPSYNELAPKPIIRRLPLLSRTTTTTSEASVLEVSKHSVENTNKNAEDDISSSNLEQMFPSFANTISNSSSTVKSISDEVTTQSISEIKKLNNQIHVEEITTSLVGYNDTSQSKDFSFDNGVPKQNSNTYDSNNVPQYSEDSIAETSKSEIESTNYDNSSKLETTTNKVDSNFQKLDIKTTTEKTIRPSQRRKLELTSVKTQIQKTNPSPKRAAGFNCLEKEMYRFYGDVRDCRLFHYCSPGFTARQVLDFRFVCEEGTIFDEDSQSCRHDVPNPKCVKRTW